MGKLLSLYKVHFRDSHHRYVVSTSIENARSAVEEYDIIEYVELVDDYIVVA